MKNILILILLATMLVAYPISAQKKYSLTFQEKDFSYQENKNAYSIICKSNDFFLLEDTLLPALPHKCVNILIPNNVSVKNIVVNKSASEVLNNVSIRNNPISDIPSKLTHKTESIIHEYAERTYPTDNVQMQSIHQMQGFTYVSFLVCPFIYDTKKRSLSLIQKIDIQFDYSVETASKSTKNVKNRYDMIDVVKELVINDNETQSIISTNTVTQSKSRSLIPPAPVTSVNYLIITTESLKNSFVPLKAWKIQKGLKTEILTTEYIYANYSGATNQLKIKNCLNDYYSNKNLKWVLLGGDDTVVPKQGCYGTYLGTDYNIPCDLFYACFHNNFNWDGDGDGIVGETTDNIDYAPEIYISRAPVRTSDHANAFVTKTLDYEQNPIMTNYVKKLLLSGNEIFEKWNGLSDAQLKSEKMYNNYISPYWTCTKTKFYDTGTDFSGDASYDMNTQNLQSQLNNGYHIVHMATHGGTTAWQTETDYYLTTNASTLSNAKKSIIITMACWTNAFDDVSDPCLSEALLRNPNGGCIAYWGSFRVGFESYGDPLLSFGESFVYTSKFFETLLTGQPSNSAYRFGAVVSKTKSNFIANCVGYTGKRWLQFTMNAIGDPELPIYTEDPSQFSGATVTQSGNVVTVNTGGVSTGCTIALTSVDFGKTYFQVIENVSTATFNNVQCPYYVTITKHNYKPFQYPEDIYVQNFTFSSDAYIKGKNIYVGNSVTPIIPQGDVIISNGANVIFDAEENTNFESGFEIGLGGTFEVRNH